MSILPRKLVVENRVARGILDGTIHDGDTIKIDVKDGKLVMAFARVHVKDEKG